MEVTSVQFPDRTHCWNVNTADSLSRLPSKSNSSSDSGIICEQYVKFVYDTRALDLQAVTLSDMSCETCRDDTLSKLPVQIQSGKWSSDKEFKPFSAIRQELSVYEGVILRGNRILVPPSLRKKVLKLSHETHQGIVKTKQFLRSRFYWPGMDESVETMIKNCQACILNQPLNKYTPLQPAQLPRGPWVSVAIDIVGPIDEKFILTYIDYYSSYPEAYVLREIKSRDLIKVLTDIIICQIWVFPKKLFPTMENNLWAQNLKIFSNHVESNTLVFPRILHEAMGN